MHDLKKLILFVGLYFTAMSTQAGYKSINAYDLHTTFFYLCCGVSVLVFLTLIYALVKFHTYNEQKMASFHKSLIEDVFWTTLPFIILMTLAIPVINMFFYK